MFKKVLKHAFTIVELVVVIAVIAALAAVLIPTFANVINSANNSSDVQSVKNMNTALAAEGINKPTSLCGVWEVLEENGYSSEVSPNYSANTFYWYKEGNCIVIVQEGKITYPTEYEGITITEARTNAGGKVTVAATVTATSLTLNSEVMLLNTDKDDASAHEGSYSTYGDTCSVCGRTLKTDSALTEFTTSLNTATGTTIVAADISYVYETNETSSTMSKTASINKSVGGTIDLAGYTISISSLSGKNGIYTGSTTTTIQNGTITMNYSWEKSSFGVIRCEQTYSSTTAANLTLDNMTVELTGAGYCVNVGSSYTNYTTQETFYPSATIKDTTIISDSSKESTYSLYIGSGASVTIEGNSKIVGILYNSNTAYTTITGGDFTECEIKWASTPSTDHYIKVSGGTFSIDPSNTQYMTVADGYSVVNNNDGTYTVKASA